MSFLRYAAVLVLASSLAGCSGSSLGKNLFGTPSSNNIASLSMHWQTTPSRSAGAQAVPLEVDAYDKWGHLITVPYNASITLSTDNACTIEFGFYSTGGGSAPSSASLSFNTPQTIGVATNPTCSTGPNPTTITASAPNVTPVTLQY